MQNLWGVVITWAPLLLILAFWAFFMTRMKLSRQGELVERNFQHMDRVEKLLERILEELERRPTDVAARP